MTIKKNALTLAAAAALTLSAGASWGQDVKGGNSALLSSNNASVASLQTAQSTPAPQGVGIACVDFTGLDSWDGLDDADNIVIELDIGAGNALTGVGWDIGVATVGDSWLSEATILHSDSTGSADLNRINLAVGTGEGAPGDMDFSSGGAIIDFSDNMLPEPTAGADGILRLELFESFDDNADAVDANYRNAAAPALCPGLALACSDQAACNAAVSGAPPIPETTPVPVNNPWALGLLALILASLGFVAVRRLA